MKCTMGLANCRVPHSVASAAFKLARHNSVPLNREAKQN